MVQVVNFRIRNNFKFKRIVIVDKVNDLNKSTIKDKALDIEFIKNILGVELLTESEFAAGKNYSIISGTV